MLASDKFGSCFWAIHTSEFFAWLAFGVLSSYPTNGVQPLARVSLEQSRFFLVAKVQKSAPILVASNNTAYFLGGNLRCSPLVTHEVKVS